MGQDFQHAEHQFELIRLSLNRFAELVRNGQCGTAIGIVDTFPGAGNIGCAGILIVLFRVVPIVILDSAAARFRQ